ncbi:hypothetical protein Ahy_B08g089160 [Arachis hypogaea]|uniref:Uncharacterized protein n=1 Tax=Arachis hypogaea TaxID=3818 RepID=A0A444XWZ0_ARAHY|nr:hypothetical protein Ahy_B08g089160 [Arachis hypogaea]
MRHLRIGSTDITTKSAIRSYLSADRIISAKFGSDTDNYRGYYPIHVQPTPWRPLKQSKTLALQRCRRPQVLSTATSSSSPCPEPSFVEIFLLLQKIDDDDDDGSLYFSDAEDDGSSHSHFYSTHGDGGSAFDDYSFSCVSDLEAAAVVHDSGREIVEFVIWVCDL